MGGRPLALDADPFDGATTLDRQTLIAAALARNPDVESARAGWRRALHRVPQATAFEDPMVSYGIAPLTIGSDVPFGQRIVVEQRLPITNRRHLAGEVALAEAEAARHDVDAVRLRLALLVSSLFDDLVVIERALAVDAQHRVLVHQLRASAEAQYIAGRGSQQDPLEAEVELTSIDRRALGHRTDRTVTIARVNGILHRDPLAELPPVPAALELPAPHPIVAAEFERDALEARPELKQQDARIRRGVGARQLADRAAVPDLGVMASYDSMWPGTTHRWMVGVSIAIPLARARREASRREAEAETEQARSDHGRAADLIRVEVHVATERAKEARAALALYEQRMLPVARARVDAARAGFIANQNDFAVVLQAERAVRDVVLEVERARAGVAGTLAALALTAGDLSGGAR